MTITPGEFDCRIAFKEWDVVCRALGRGEQTIILRKGGIHEGREGFRVEHDRFWLFPTRFHAELSALTPDGQALLTELRETLPAPAGKIRLEYLAHVVEVRELASEAEALALAGCHLWSEETVLRRFHYKRPGLYCLVVRIYARPDALMIDDTPEMAGCRSWVSLPTALETRGLTPVLSDEAFAVASQEVRRRWSRQKR